MLENNVNLPCPHSHKASLVLDDAEIASDFLSKHFESCEKCKSKIDSLKESRSVLVKQIPFSAAPQEIRELFKNESVDLSSKIKNRIRGQKLKRVEEVSKGIKMFGTDLRTSLLSKQFLFSLAIVGSSWAYYKFLN
jgi:hypothetical protein